MKKIFQKLRNPAVLRGIIFLVLLTLVFTGIFFYLTKTGRISIENSIADSQIIPIAPMTPGILKSVYVHEGQKVIKGDALANVGSEILTAYSDGIIISTSKQFGSLVNAQNPPVQMLNPNDMRISGTIDENKGLNRIKVGQIASFTIDALPEKTYWGYIDEIAPSAKQTQLTFSISSERPTQQFLVFARFNSLAYPEIKNGMSAKMTVYEK